MLGRSEMSTRQRRYGKARAILARAVCAACAALAAPAGAISWPWEQAADAPRHEIRDPHYGDVLFHFYQEHYFAAVTNLMVSQHFERVSHHAEEAEVLRGGLFLSYGLHKEAGEIFTRLIEQGAPPKVRDRAWYYLAKIRYQRGLFPEAEEAIGRIAAPLPGPLEEDRQLLQANLLMSRGDYAGAARVLEAAAKAPDGVYARYNLGVALVKSGDTAKGVALLDAIGTLPQGSEELRALRDKANVALGFSALQQNEPEKARGYLERVRLNGMMANKALLGFGWASAALKQPKDALVPWTELASRDASDAAVLEAKLAVPYGYAQLGAYAQSLDLYNGAIADFDRESAHLDESIAAIRSGRLLDGLLERNPGEEMGWFWSIEQLPQMPHGAHLSQVLAEHDFQEAFKNWRDLQFLAGNLKRWSDSLGAMSDMLANRRLAFAQRLPATVVAQRARDIDRQAQRRDALATELQQAEADADGRAFADAQDRAIAQRLERVRALLDRIGKGPAAEEAGERVRRVEGAYLWSLADAYADREWNARKGLRELDAGIAEARQRDASLSAAQRDEPARFDAFAARIAELDARLRALMPRIDELSSAQRQYVQELAVAVLERQKERLLVYGTQARFAVAQIYDRANLPKDDAHAPAQ